MPWSLTSPQQPGKSVASHPMLCFSVLMTLRPIVLLNWFFAFSAHALPIHEIGYVQGPVADSTIQQWREQPPVQEWIVHHEAPRPRELERWLAIARTAPIRFEVEEFPRSDSLTTWKRLAETGARLVLLNASPRTAEQVRMLDEVGFASVRLVTSDYPGESHATLLATIQTPFQMTIQSYRLPLFTDRDALRKLPANLDLTFAADYWPGYSHMDLFNMIPQPIHLRISGYFPSGTAVDYLSAIQRLRQITVEVDSFPPASDWEKLGSGSITWIARGPVPSGQAIDDFIGTGDPLQRNILIDRDTPLTGQERERLRNSPIRVDWIRRLP